ncbi:MAG TPA: PfkB family carbohydrate kinase [Methanobacteriaceae archaeon]|nr:PfkB family carbohydrate kinase [Methanobacteriaceae archaeon]
MVHFLLLGPVTRDTIIREGSIYESTGGPVYYQAGVLNSLGIEVTALITLGKSDKNLLNSFPNMINIIPSFRDDTAHFENCYPSQDPNQRKQKASLPCNSLKETDFKGLDLYQFDAFLVSPLSPWDVPLETLEYLHQTEKPIYIGVQGYLRYLEDHKVVLRTWENYKSFLNLSKIIFLDEIEARVIIGTDYSDLEEIARRLAEHGPDEVVITLGDRGSLIYSHQKKVTYRIPAVTPHKTVDPTGLGDTYMAAYLSKRQKSFDPLECGIFASQIASLKLENRGALSFNLKEK